jgi:carbon-monoxide dehydrogenase small subunit
MKTLELTVNGQPHRLEVDERSLLVDVLRQHLGLTGTHVGCDTSQCGCCTVLLNGDAVKSCSMLALQAHGANVTSIEGLAQPGGAAHPVQGAFSKCHALQCGYCTPGMIMATVSLLRSCPKPSDAEIEHGLEGNLCRCTGYINIAKAVHEAAQQMPSGKSAGGHA